MGRQGLKKYPLLYRLQRADLKNISNNIRLTNHAKERINERYDRETNGSIGKAIRESKIGYVETDGTISIGTKDDGTFKIIQPKQPNHKYLIVTYYEPSINNHDIWHKYKLALRGHNRG